MLHQFLRQSPAAVNADIPSANENLPSPSYPAPQTWLLTRMLKSTFSAGLLCLISLMICGAAQAQEAKPEIRAQPLYEQCQQLQTGDQSAPGLLIALKDKDASKRAKAAGQLAKSCDSRAVAPLIAVLKDEDPIVRIAAVESLGQLGDRGAADALIETLSDTDWRVRAALARTLCSFQYYPTNNAALNALVNPSGKSVTEEGDMRARCLGVLMVNQLHDVRFSRKAIGFLFTFLDNKDPALRQVAEQTAMELKNTRNGYHELIGILQQNSFPDFRRKAAYYLGKFNLEIVRPALLEASIGDRDATVQRVAKEALEGMKASKQ